MYTNFEKSLEKYRKLQLFIAFIVLREKSVVNFRFNENNVRVLAIA